MTVPTSDNREEYTGNDATTSFDYAFKIFEDSDLQVYLQAADGTETLLFLNTNYSVSGAGDLAGGSVTYPLSGDPLASDEKLIILRVLDVVQETDLRNQGAYYPQVVEDEFDRSRMIDQQQQEEINRALKRPAAEDGYDADGRQIKNGAAGTDGSDFVIKSQVDNRFLNDVITKTSGNWNGKGLRLLSIQTSDTPQSDEAVNRQHMEAYFNSVVLGGGPYANLRSELNSFDPGKGSDLVAHTGTSDTVTEALDTRTIFVGSVAELESLPSPTDGQEVLALGTPFIWSESESKWKANGPINVKLFGASGDGVTDDGSAVRSAIESLSEGETLYFPPGTYTTTHPDTSIKANWIILQESGCKIVGKPGTVFLENFAIAIEGSFETPINVGAAGFTSGDNELNTASTHGFVGGDVIQALSQINSYSTDAGNFQLGSENPTTLFLAERRFSEIHRVQEVLTSTTFTIDDTVLYADYADNISGLNDPMTGVASAQIRKINPVFDTVIYGITFVNETTSSFDGFFAQGAYGLRFEKCGFVATDLPGTHVRTQHCYDVQFVDCSERRSPSGASGSAWNSFILGAGTQNSFFRSCNFKGGQQTIDWTPFSDSTSPFYLSEDLDGATTQVMGAYNCVFEDIVDAATSHPGTYICDFHDNKCINVNTGFRGRSRKMSIQNNMIKCNSVGIALSAFYEDTLISGNNITQAIVSAQGGLPGAGWLGINIVPMSSETMNNNDLDNVVIVANSFLSISFQSSDMGIQFRHVGNGTPPNGSFTKFTDTIKTNLSKYVISNNVFYRCGVKVNQFINGVSCIQNQFDQCAVLAAFFESAADSARHRIGGNYFDGTHPTNTIITRAPSTLTYGYNTTHRVSGNNYAIAVANNSLADSATFNTD